MKRLLGIALVLVLILGCVPLAHAQPTRMFTDSVGRTVEIPADITRIAPSGKMAHIVLYAIAPDAFVCLSNAWTKDAKQFFPEDVLSLPVVGQFYGDSELNMEELAKANPEVIIDIGEKKKSVKEDMDAVQAQLGIPTVFIEATTAGMGECYRMLGELLGRPEQGEALAAYCEEIYQKTQNTMAGCAAEAVGLSFAQEAAAEAAGNACEDVAANQAASALAARPRKAKLLYCLGENGQSVIGKGSYHAEIIDLLADNLAAIDSPSSKAFGDEVDFEQLLQWQPEVILFAPEVNYDMVQNDILWQQMQAVKDGNYYRVPSGPFNWMGFPPSVNRYMGMIWVAQTLYPEQFQYDLRAETQRYYKLFYHYDLTDEKYDEMMVDSLRK